MPNIVSPFGAKHHEYRNLERKTDLHQLVLEGILMDSGVPLCHWTEWFDFVYYGVPRSDAPASARAARPRCNPFLLRCRRSQVQVAPEELETFFAARQANNRPDDSGQGEWTLARFLARPPIAQVSKRRPVPAAP